MKRRGPHMLHKLSALGLPKLKTSGWYADGGSLYLEVTPSGGKRWVMRIMVGGRRRDFGLGPFDKVSLAAARERAAEYRAKAYAGLDPTTGVTASSSGSSLTFEDAAHEVHRLRKAQWSSGKHVDQWIKTLHDHAFPLIGARPVAAITTADALAVLSPIWTTKPETGRRVRQRMRAVLEWARAAAHRTGDNPVDLIGHALPRHTAGAVHHEALPYQQVPKFFVALAKGSATPVTKLAFAFLILTAARTIEVRFTDLAEIDDRDSLWTIPAPRMKARKPHVVPLSPQALRIVKNARANLGGAATGLLFPDATTGAALSENRFLNARDDLGYRGLCTPHGFRSSFRDWVAEETNYPPEVAEMALAHTIKSKVEAAYRRGDLLEKRRQLMNAWASFVTSKL